jgi:hypothetical protein
MPTAAFPQGHLRLHASEHSCQNCPPDRVCAWACVQGAGIEDIVIGAVLEQTLVWPQPNEPEAKLVRQVLWDSFNQY